MDAMHSADRVLEGSMARALKGSMARALEGSRSGARGLKGQGSRARGLKLKGSIDGNSAEDVAPSMLGRPSLVEGRGLAENIIFGHAENIILGYRIGNHGHFHLLSR